MSCEYELIQVGCQFQSHVEFEIKSDVLRNMKLQHRYDKSSGKARSYYIIEYRPVIKIQGRNLRCELWLKGERKAVGMLNANTAASLETAFENLSL